MCVKADDCHKCTCVWTFRWVSFSISKNILPHLLFANTFLDVIWSDVTSYLLALICPGTLRTCKEKEGRQRVGEWTKALTSSHPQNAMAKGYVSSISAIFHSLSHSLNLLVPSPHICNLSPFLHPDHSLFHPQDPPQTQKASSVATLSPFLSS